jgi:multidrug efflux pump subunit AcrB
VVDVKVVTDRDTDTGQIRVTVEFAEQADPDRAADAAWNAVYDAAKAAARARGTVPEGLRAAREEHQP